MILIIAEKPSQARDYAEALGGFKRKEGYLESDNAYITWGFGHLIEMKEDTAYREKGGWNKSYLPLIPDQFFYEVGRKEGKIDRGKQQQLNIIKSLANNSSEIINATDADREGELIFLYIYNFLNLKLPYKRLWISSLTKGDIIKGFKNLLPASDMENLGKAGYARAISDWLVGINGTQSATLQLGNRNLLTIGRVQTSILKIICERYFKNKHFKEIITYKILTEHQKGGEMFESNTAIFENKEEAEKILQSLNDHHIFNEVIKTEKKILPPLLHSIDSLIIEANRIFGYSGQDTLAIAQSLYEKKLTTYPRTDSQYINEEKFGELKDVLPNLCQQILGINYSFKTNNPKSVNAKKLTGSHDAIVPTGEKKGIDKLSEKEKNIYVLLLHRCMESFSTIAVYNKEKFIFENKGIEFYSYNSILKEEGWKAFSFNRNFKEDIDTEEQNFKLNIQKGAKISIIGKGLVEIKSKPPKLYTDENLIPDLTNIGKFLKEENPELLKSLKGEIDLDDVQIGTQATRPAIIEGMKKKNLIMMDKKKYLPTDKGLQLYEKIKNLKVSNIANTALLERDLKLIEQGILSEKDFYNSLNIYVKSIVEDIFRIENPLDLNKKEKENYGQCPKCKNGLIVKGKVGYGCNQWKQGCDFVIWEKIAGKSLTEKNIRDLVSKGITSSVIKGLKSQKGIFEARISLTKDFKIEFVFDKN